MSQENVELVRSMLEDFRAGELEFDADGMLTRMTGEETWDPDIEWDASDAGMPDISGVYHGKDAVRQWWREWLAAWETTLFEYELVDAGDRVVALIDQQMRGRSTGIEVPVGKYAQVVTVRDGALVHWKLYASQHEALEAVGLSEQAMSTKNVESVQSFHIAWNEEDLERFLERLDEDLKWRTAAEREVGGGSGYSGHEGARAVWAEYRDLFHGFRVERMKYFDFGERVLALGYVRATGRGSGIDIAGELAQLFTLREGRIVRCDDYLSHAEGRNAAGLSEQDAHAES